MSTTRAQAAQLQDTARQFETANQNLGVMLNQLMKRLEGLESQWIGRGGAAFTHVKQRWAADQRILQQALSETAAAIRTSGATYESTDSDASSRIMNAGGSAGPSLPL